MRHLVKFCRPCCEDVFKDKEGPWPQMQELNIMLETQLQAACHSVSPEIRLEAALGRVSPDTQLQATFHGARPETRLVVALDRVSPETQLQEAFQGVCRETRSEATPGGINPETQLQAAPGSFRLEAHLQAVSHTIRPETDVQAASGCAMPEVQLQGASCTIKPEIQLQATSECIMPETQLLSISSFIMPERLQAVKPAVDLPATSTSGDVWAETQLQDTSGEVRGGAIPHRPQELEDVQDVLLDRINDWVEGTVETEVQRRDEIQPISLEAMRRFWQHQTSQHRQAWIRQEEMRVAREQQLDVEMKARKRELEAKEKREQQLKKEQERAQLRADLLRQLDEIKAQEEADGD